MDLVDFYLKVQILLFPTKECSSSYRNLTEQTISSYHMRNYLQD